MSRLLAPLLAAVLLAAGPVGVRADERQAAEAITASAALQDGFARMTFVWEAPVQGTAAIRNGVLVIRFARPFTIDPVEIEDGLGVLAGQVRRDADGRGLRIALDRRDMRVASLDDGRRFVVDLLPASFTGTPPPPPPLEPPAPPPIDTSNPDALPVLDVRAWPHADFSRLVFDFPRYTDYSFVMQDDRLSIRFATPMRPNFRRVEALNLPWVGTPSWRIADEALVVDVPIDHGAGLHHFRDGTKIAFDIRPPASDGSAARTPSPPGPAPAIVSGAPPENVPPAPEAPPLALEPASATPPPAESPAVALPAQPRPKPDAPSAASPPAMPDAPVPPATADMVPEPDSPVRPGRQTAEAPAAPEAPPVPAEAPETDAAAAPVAGQVGFAISERREGLVLSFTFPQPVGAAVFRRGPALWAVFDGAGEIDLSAIDRQFFATIAGKSVVRSDDALAVRLVLAKPVLASVVQDGPRWTLTLSERLEAPGAALALVREARTVGPSLVRAPMPGVSRAVNVSDPDAGDVLRVVTARGPAIGLIAPRRFVEFQALASAHGLAVLPLTDDLVVETDAEGGVIRTPRGLTLSSGDVGQTAGGGPVAATVAPAGFLDFARFRRDSGEAFLDERRRLLAAIGAPGADVTRARFDMARFYLANGLAPEALGMLNLLAREDETAALDPGFLALRGLASYLLGRTADARADLLVPALADDPYAALWRALVLAEARDWPAARRHLALGEGLIDRLPADWQARVRIAGAQAALAVNDLEGADTHLARVPQDVPRPLALEAELVRGRMMERLGRTAEALASYQSVQASGYRPLATAAAFSEVDLRNRTGSLSNEEAIARLDQLRFQWRGDRTELAVLRRLAELYIDQGDFRNGLGIMRVAVAQFGQTDEGRALHDQMAQVFERLFLGGAADELPPVQALGLYYDFRELTPIGRLGDDMIRKLADRLIAVDLLPQAGELLQHQIENRLDGVARAQVATRLAVVHLLDRKPEQALTAIRTTRQSLLPDDLARERRLLEARALSDLKQYEAALDVVDGLEDPDALRLRADIYWASRNWDAAATKLEALVGEAWKEEGPLSDAQRFDILRAAVAMSLANDPAGLARLRATYGSKMAAGPDARAFDVVTATIDTQGVSFRELASRIAGTDTLEAFMAGFRDRFDVKQGEAPTN